MFERKALVDRHLVSVKKYVGFDYSVIVIQLLHVEQCIIPVRTIRVHEKQSSCPKTKYISL